MLRGIYLFCIFLLPWFTVFGQCPTLIGDMRNEAFVDAILEDPELIEAHKRLGDHANRTNPEILRSRKAFDKFDGYGKNNPYTGSEMFYPETGGYVVIHPKHNIQGDAGSKAEFVMAEAFGKDGERVTLLDETPRTKGEKTPDASIEGYGIFDFKNIDVSASNLVTNVQSKITKSREQAENIAFNLGDHPDIVPEHVNEAITNALNTADVRMPKSIGVVYKDGTCLILTLDKLQNGARF